MKSIPVGFILAHYMKTKLKWMNNLVNEIFKNTNDLLSSAAHTETIVLDTTLKARRHWGVGGQGGRGAGGNAPE